MMFENIFMDNKHLLDEQEVKELISIANLQASKISELLKEINTLKNENEYLRSLIK